MQIGWFAGVGSRATPDDVLKAMGDLACVLTSLGYGLSSGGANGADLAFQRGAERSKRFTEVGYRIYLPEDGFNGFYHNPANGFYDATVYTDTYARATELALEARGGAYGLNEKGLKLHTRNAFQVHGHTLDQPVKMIFYWAEPRSRKREIPVKGGTNTAARLAEMQNVPLRLNLFFPEQLKRVEDFIERHRDLL